MRSRYFRSLLTPANAAALALIAIQVGIGILYKACQKDGSYAFSASSSITISETLKFLLSTCLFYRECRRRHATANPEYCVIPAPQRDSIDEKEGDSEDSLCLSDSQEGSPGRSWNASRQGVGARERMSVTEFIRYCTDEVPVATVYGFAQLALLYALINNTVFVLYKLADPGTIQLVKSGITLVTAIVMYFCLGTRIFKMQWVAIALQICGLVVTQYHPEMGASYPYSTYTMLLFQTFLSATSGVYNQSLCKSQNASLHADNMVLYASGAVINLLVHCIIRIIKLDEPGFFTGYGEIGAIMVILSNVFIGIAMTAVYKYADAVIKCFATAVSTAILLYVSPVLFDVGFSLLVVPGTFVVFIATWLYMNFTPPAAASTSAADESTVRLYTSKLLSPFERFSAKGKHRNFGISAWTTITVLIIAALTLWDAASALGDRAFGSHHGSKTVESPFKNTLAFVRWNSDAHPERMPTVEAYAPFFHTLHFSMPNYTPDQGNDYVNLTHDSWKVTDLIFKGVSETMKVILADGRNGIEGLLYFHFDLWVDPLGFQDMSLDRMWFVDSPEPKYLCMNDTMRYPEWHGWWGMHTMAMDAQKNISDSDKGYVVDTTEWCVGWSDLYHIPREYFEDYIFLTDYFYHEELFHEVSIPTMLRIIDHTRRQHTSRSLITRIGDCWGSCCAEGAKPEDVIWRRCGHRLDYTNDQLVETHYNRLAEQTEILRSGRK